MLWVQSMVFRALSTQARVALTSHTFTGILYKDTFPASSLAVLSTPLAMLGSPDNRLKVE